MKKEDFKFEEPKYYITNAYVYDNNDYLLIINKGIFDNDTIEYANKLVEKYIKERNEILEYMLDDRLREFYSHIYNYSDEYIKNNIGRPQIRIYFKKDDEHPNSKFQYGGVIDYCESKLDEHIISIEFGDDFKFIYGVEMNG